MRRFFVRVTAICLSLLMLLPALPLTAAEVCAEEKLTLILLPRTGESIAVRAAEQGLGADEFALSEQGRAALAETDALLDDISALAASVCHCYAERTRWTAALLGIAVEVDAADLPELRAAGDLAPGELAFDVYRPAAYSALDEPLPDAELNIVEYPLGEVGKGTQTAAGSGSVIAVIDTGFDLTTRGFSLPEGAVPALAGEALDARLALVDKPDAAVSEKIPFAYNYADPDADIDSAASHGTKVAALAAAYVNSEYDGEAPGAQLLLMKVFGEEKDARANECAVVSAINDALLLGADVINLSFGATYGETESGTALARAIAGARTSGNAVVCAAGNKGESGAGSLFYSMMGETLYPTAYTDHSTLTTPASVTGTFAVGAATGSLSRLPVLCDEAGEQITYTDSCAEFFADAASGSTVNFAALLKQKRFTYVAVGGVGSPEDYSGLDLQGKVALVERGEISFAQKAANAAAAGAIGLIVYDNDPATDGALTMELTGAPIPAIMINIADGARLAAAGEGELCFADDDPSLRGMAVRDVAEFSSRGLREDFTLAPALLALGDNFVGLSTNNTIAVLSGTSYASAQVSGALAVLLSCVREEALCGTEELDALDVAQCLLQNTAVPLMTGDIPVSVRTQGAGVLNTDAAMTAPLLLQGNDGGAVTLTGEDDSFTLVFTLRNLADTPVSFTLTASALGDAYTQPNLRQYSNNPAAEERLIALGYDLDNPPFCTTGALTALDAQISLDGEVLGTEGRYITLAGGETVEYRVTVTLSAEEYAARIAAFPSGFFVEGRVSLAITQNPLGGEQTLTLPYAVFCGAWEQTPILSPTVYGEGEQLYVGQSISAPMRNGKEVELGVSEMDTLRQNNSIATELLSFNPNYLSGPLRITLFLERNVSHWRVSVTDADGAEVYRSSGDALSKAYSFNGIAVGVRVPLWQGCVTDNEKYICPDGEYTISLTLFGAAGGEQTLSIPVRIDTTPPELLSAAFRREGDEFLLELTVRDNEYIRLVEVADRSSMVDFDYTQLSAEAVLAAGRGASIPLAVDGNQLYRQYFYVTVVDYAYNEVIVRIDRDQLFAAWEKGD